MFFLLPYKPGSRSARALAEGIGAKRIRRRNSRYRYRDTHKLINFGSSDNPTNAPDNAFLNHPENVALACNKLKFFQSIDPNWVNVPHWTSDKQVAQSWLDEGCTVVVRHLLCANSGRGIELVSDGEVPSAPLYTKYIKKTDEFRVHVVFNEAIDVQRKMRSRDVPDEQVNWQIRNTAGGFIFGREGVELTPELEDQAVWAVQELGLDFGAVDIIYNRNQDKYYVLEVNTAPGLEGTTLQKYTNAFLNL